VKYACIARYRGEYPVRLMCRVLGVSRAGFYAAQRRAPSARARADQRLRLEIRAIHRATQRRYGAPKIHRELRGTRGIRCSRKRVARLMRVDGLRAKRSRRFRVTTQSTHRYPIAANQLHRRFAPAAYTERDQVWAADLTYIPTREGWLYLAVVLDLASRRVIGWAVASRLGDELALSALRQALAYRCPLPGALHHSDRGAQYASGAYRQLLAAHGLRCSMSRAGDCWDNAVVESFFATLKTELVADADWPTRAAAHRALSLFIDVWYNHQRRHASLGFLSPVQYERELARLRTA
jgi:transposase InsO family protein